MAYLHIFQNKPKLQQVALPLFKNKVTMVSVHNRRGVKKCAMCNFNPLARVSKADHADATLST
eukprot:2580885-Amphidinium_carterae.2